MLTICKVDPNNIFGNWVYVSDKDYTTTDVVFGKINDTTIQIKPVPWIEPGHIGLNMIQRQFFNVKDGEAINVETVTDSIPKLEEINFQIISKNQPLESIPDEQIDKFMDYVYHGLFATVVSQKHPTFIIPHPFDDNDVVIINVVEKKPDMGTIDNDTVMNLVH